MRTIVRLKPHGAFRREATALHDHTSLISPDRCPRRPGLFTSPDARVREAGRLAQARTTATTVTSMRSTSLPSRRCPSAWSRSLEEAHDVLCLLVVGARDGRPRGVAGGKDRGPHPSVGCGPDAFRVSSGTRLFSGPDK